MARFFLIRQGEKGVQPASKPLASLKLIANMTQWELFLWQKQPWETHKRNISDEIFGHLSLSYIQESSRDALLPFIATSLGQLEVMSIDGLFPPWWELVSSFLGHREKDISHSHFPKESKSGGGGDCIYTALMSASCRHLLLSTPLVFLLQQQPLASFRAQW